MSFEDKFLKRRRYCLFSISQAPDDVVSKEERETAHALLQKSDADVIADYERFILQDLDWQSVIDQEMEEHLDAIPEEIEDWRESREAIEHMAYAGQKNSKEFAEYEKRRASQGRRS